MRFHTPNSIGRAIRSSTARRRCSRSSSTRRCTRRRCSTCGIACRSTQKQRPGRLSPAHRRRARRRRNGSRFPPGRATLGVDRERSRSAGTTSIRRCAADVAPFAIERHDVTNAAFLEFVEAGGYDEPQWWTRRRLGSGFSASASRIRCSGSGTMARWFWRGMFELIPLPPRWPVYVSHAEASAFARWRGARLPTEAEFQRAAYGTPDGERARIPGATRRPQPTHGVFDFASWDPEPAGSHPAGRERVGRRGSRRQRLGVDEHDRSRRFPASARWPRIPSTRPTSSTASTSS